MMVRVQLNILAVLFVVRAEDEGWGPVSGGVERPSDTTEVGGTYLPDFENEKRLREAYRSKIEKYVTRQENREFLFCDGNNPLGAHGMLSTES